MIRRLIRNRSGAAAAEMALVSPLLIFMILATIEFGNFFWDQHILEKGVRDGARYAARQRFSNFTACTGAPPQAVIDDTKNLVRTGTFDTSANALLPNWSSATFSVTMSCAGSLNTSTGSQTPAGIYANFAGGAPSILVSASLPYRPIIGGFVRIFGTTNVKLNATQSAAVAGL